MIANERTEKMSPIERCNILIVIITVALKTVISLFSTGSLLQNVLMDESIGLSKASTSILTVTLPQFAQMAAIGLTFFFADRLSGIIRKSAWCYATVIFQFLAILVAWQYGINRLTFSLLFAAILICNVFGGIDTVWAYKIPYLIYHITYFGSIQSVSGIVGNIVSSGLSILIPILTSLNYGIVMRCFFISGIALTVLYVFLEYRLKVLPGAKEDDRQTERVHFGELFRQPTGRHLLLSNFIRGLSMGVFQCATIIAAKLFDVSGTELSVLVTVTTIGAIAGNLIFTLIGKPRHLARKFTVTAVLYALLFPLLFFVKNWYVFIGLFFLLQIDYIIISILVPTSVCLLVSYRDSGSYTSVRMMLTTGGTAVGGFVSGLILDRSTHPLSIFLLLVSAGLLQLFYGLIYAAFFRKYRKDIS